MQKETVTIQAGTVQSLTRVIDHVSEEKQLTVVVEENAQANVTLAFHQAESTLFDVQLILAGPGAQLNLVGLVIGYGQQQPTINVDLQHLTPRTKANVIFRGVLTDQARQDWKGMIKIAPDAQQTNSWLEDRTLLLSPMARANAIPSLEIEANDVRASHAATVGKIDPATVFYLQSRGLDPVTAQRLIVNGFVRPVLPKEEALRQQLTALIEQEVISNA